MNWLRQLLLCVCLMIAEAIPCSAQVMVDLNFSNNPISQVFKLYADLTGEVVNISPGTYPNITLKSEGRIREEDVRQFIISCLESNNITIITTESGISVSSDPNAALTPVRSTSIDKITVISPRPRRQRANMPNHVGIQQTYSDDELKKHLIEYRQQLKQHGLPQPELTPKEIELGIQKE